MTDAQRARVHPFRGQTAPMPDADRGAQFLRIFWAAPYRPGTGMLDAWQQGEGTAAALDTFVREAPATDVEVEAAMLATLDYWSRRGMVIKEAQGGGNDRYFPIDAWFVRRWLAAGGLPFALRVLDAFTRIEVDAATRSIKPRATPAWWCLEVGHLGIFHVLRRAIAVASDYDAGLAEAARIRETAPLWLRAALAFAFPDEPWWQVDLRDATPKKKGARIGLEAWALVTTAIDEAQLDPILASMARDPQPFATDTALYGYTLVHRFGDAAAPHLIAYLEVIKELYAKESFGDCLALTETPETAAFFAARMKDRVLGKLAKDYVKNA